MTADAPISRAPGGDCPAFVAQLSEDPEKAFAAFYRYAVNQLDRCPPQPLRRAPRGQREDLVHEVVLHCCRDDFHVLRAFRPQRGRFEVWFNFVARNRILDVQRSLRSSRVAEAPSELELDEIADPAPGPVGGAEAGELLEAVYEAVEQLGDKCRILVLGAAEGLRPRELTRLLGWPASRNKKVSDDLRACRARLRRLLAEKGFDLEDGATGVSSPLEGA